MADYLCLDGGTTNTRITLVSDGNIIDVSSYNIGATKSIGNGSVLRKTIKNGINDILNRNPNCKNRIARILASGMITGEYGLCELPHIALPVSLLDLKNSIYEIKIPDISDIPFAFIRGVKEDSKTLETADIMRGEETELAGLFRGAGIYILLGSHSKIIDVNEDGIVENFKTMLTGEMISAIADNTILNGAVNMSISETNERFLMYGFKYTEENGINDALFKVRILNNIFKRSPVEIYNFYIGTILCNEIVYILKHNASKIILGGNRVIKTHMSALLNNLSNAEIYVVSDEEAKNAPAIGAVRIYEYSEK